VSNGLRNDREPPGPLMLKVICASAPFVLTMLGDAQLACLVQFFLVAQIEAVAAMLALEDGIDEDHAVLTGLDIEAE
jgi:hypothetical protein